MSRCVRAGGVAVMVIVSEKIYHTLVLGLSRLALPCAMYLPEEINACDMTLQRFIIFSIVFGEMQTWH